MKPSTSHSESRQCFDLPVERMFWRHRGESTGNGILSPKTPVGRDGAPRRPRAVQARNEMEMRVPTGTGYSARWTRAGTSRRDVPTSGINATSVFGLSGENRLSAVCCQSQKSGNRVPVCSHKPVNNDLHIMKSESDLDKMWVMARSSGRINV